MMTYQEMSRKAVGDYCRQHRAELCEFLSPRVEGRENAEDMVQEVFLRLLCTDKMISSVTLPALVYTMARRLVIDYWRHRASVRQHERYARLQSASIYNKVGASSVYSMREVEELLERGMARLNDRQRKVYKMNVIDGMKVAEISQRLGENYKSVEGRLGTARKEVRRYMARMLAS